MNIESCMDKNMPGYRAGKNGKCYVYMTDDETTKRLAYKLAEKERNKLSAKEKRNATSA
jgi:hypothetical protein